MFVKTLNVGAPNKSFSDQQWSDGSKWPYCLATRYDYVVLQHSNPIPWSKMWTAHLPNSTYAAECRHKKWIPVFQRLSDGPNWWFLIMTRWNSQGIETQHHHVIISPFMVFLFRASLFLLSLLMIKEPIVCIIQCSTCMNLWACVYICLFSLTFSSLILFIYLLIFMYKTNNF